jgi:hypothetical protein
MPIVTNDPYQSKIKAAWEAHAKDRQELPRKFELPQGAAAADKSLEGRMNTMRNVRSGNAFQVPEQISAPIKSLQKRMETKQYVGSGNAFRVPEEKSASVNSLRKRMETTQAARSGNMFTVQGPKSVVEIAAAANARMLQNRQAVYARLQGN